MSLSARDTLPLWVRFWTPARVAWALGPLFLTLGLWAHWPNRSMPPDVGIGPERAHAALKREGAAYGPGFGEIDWSPNRPGQSTEIVGSPGKRWEQLVVWVGEDTLISSRP